MTGRYTIRLGTQSNVIYWDTPWGVDLNETFIPQNLEDAGYKNRAMYGKSHLGMFAPEYTPTRRGFTEYKGYLQGCGSHYTHVASCCNAGSPDHDQDYICPGGGAKDFRGYDWFNDTTPDFTANTTNSAILVRDAAVDFLNRQESETSPFLLYLPFQNVHVPHTCDVKFRDLYNDRTDLSEDEKTLFGYITEMDDAIGHVMEALHASGRYENTVIIFSSDNGAPPGGPDVDHQTGENPGWIARDYPFRGYKTLIWEGGTRVAGFVHSQLLPKEVQGTESHELFHVTDWLPTIVGLGKGSTKRNRPLDGHDIWESITKGSASPRSEMLYGVNPLCNGGQAGAPKAALRMGKYKIMAWCYDVAGIDGANLTQPVNAPPGTKGADPEFTKGPVLYDLDADPSERVNIAAQNPDVVAKMLVRLKELAEEMVEPMQWDPPFQGPDYYCASCPKHPGGIGPMVPWGPWVNNLEEIMAAKP